MLNRFYESELGNLRRLAAEFSRAHPAIAPMLSASASDPDVERLLEGVAFLTGLVRQRVDDDFPEFIQALGNLVLPHYLRPIPSCTIVEFKPSYALNEPRTIAPGAELASVPVDGTPCIFRTCYPVDLEPLNVQSVSLIERTGLEPIIRLELSLNGIKVSDWKPRPIRFFLGGPTSDALRMYHLLNRFVSRVAIYAQGAETLILGPRAIVPVGFAEDEALIPYPPQSYPGYRILQEYFVMLGKFLFVNLSGIEGWRERGSGTSITIDLSLKEKPPWMPPITGEQFVLNATPAINLVSLDAEPVMLDHRKTEYRIAPSAPIKPHYQIFSIDSVVGHPQGSAQAKEYKPFGFFGDRKVIDQRSYQVVMKPSPIERNLEPLLSVAYSSDSVPEPELLVIRLTCTNGSLPSSLHTGDISKATDRSPERIDFRNLRPPTPTLQPLSDDTLLGRLLSHLSLNYLSIATADNLRALLHLYVFPAPEERGAEAANRRRIDGIQNLRVQSANRIVGGSMMRGQQLSLKCRGDHFAGNGDIFLFGSILDRFLSDYAAINTYTSFEIEDVSSGELYQWPARIGQQPLI